MVAGEEEPDGLKARLCAHDDEPTPPPATTSDLKRGSTFAGTHVKSMSLILFFSGVQYSVERPSGFMTLYLERDLGMNPQTIGICVGLCVCVCVYVCVSGGYIYVTFALHKHTRTHPRRGVLHACAIYPSSGLSHRHRHG